MDVNSLMLTVFSGLSVLVVEDVADGGDVVLVTARTREDSVPCPVCGTPTAKVHGYHGRTVTDVPVDARQVVVHLRVRRLVCPVPGCRRQTFREQIPGLLERHQRRTVRLAAQISQVARELCGRAAARLAGLLAVPVSRSTALRHLRRLPLPHQAVSRVIGVDDALRRRHRYATIITDAQTGRRVAVLPDRETATLESWLREHGSGVEVVCRDGSATYAEAVRRVLPDAVQVSDRWHLWRNLCDKVLLEVRAHAGCWATINPPRPGGVREQTTRERWNKIHDLLGQGVGLLDCALPEGAWARSTPPSSPIAPPSYPIPPRPRPIDRLHHDKGHDPRGRVRQTTGESGTRSATRRSLRLSRSPESARWAAEVRNACKHVGLRARSGYRSGAGHSSECSLLPNTCV